MFCMHHIYSYPSVLLGLGFSRKERVFICLVYLCALVYLCVFWVLLRFPARFCVWDMGLFMYSFFRRVWERRWFIIT